MIRLHIKTAKRVSREGREIVPFALFELEKDYGRVRDDEESGDAYLGGSGGKDPTVSSECVDEF